MRSSSEADAAEGDREARCAAGRQLRGVAGPAEPRHQLRRPDGVEERHSGEGVREACSAVRALIRPSQVRSRFCEQIWEALPQ